MTLLPEVAAALARLGDEDGRPLSERTVAEVRGLFGGLHHAYPAGPEVRAVERLAVGGIEVRRYVPIASPPGTILFLHGGGWVLGDDLDEFDTLARKLAVRTGWAVAVPGYRLAPEHRYPVAVDDAWDALRWAAAVGKPVALVGDSAGGNLAAAVAQRAAERGGPAIVTSVLVYPVVDSDVDSESYRAEANQLLVDRATMCWFWDQYVPDPARRLEPDASPLRAVDVGGLPPTVIIRAEHDVLTDQIEAYAARLVDAGVPVTQHVHRGQVHGFFATLVLPGHEVALDQIAGALSVLG